MGRRNFWRGAIGSVALLGLAGGALALQEGKDEKDRLKACEASLCQFVAKKGPATGDFTCALQKTWVKQKIQEGASASMVSWSYGDARCTLDIKLPRADMAQALTAADFTMQFPEHTVNCQVERDKELVPVTLKFAPKVQFKGGKAHKAWVNLKNVEGPGSIKGLAYSIAKLEDGLGIFHKRILKAINNQIGPKCEKGA